nr:MAG TPA: Large polyvalent protein-associated domain 3 [Bacteriophage sp.]
MADVFDRLNKIRTVDDPGKTPAKATERKTTKAAAGGNALERLDRVKTVDAMSRLDRIQTVDGKASAPKSSGKAEAREVPQPSGTSMGQGLALGVGGPSRQQVAQSVDRAEELRKAGYSTGTMLRGMAEQGGDQFVGGVLHTVKDYVEKPLFTVAGAVLGNPELGENAPVKQFSEWFDRRAEERREKYAENAAKGGTAYEKVNEYGSATVAAIPQALVALGTAGGSTAAQGLNAVAAASTRAPGILTTLKNVGEGLARNPNFWTSFLQVAGDGYEEAKADGASDAKAGLFGMVNGLANAAVEVGGGIQTLPAELQRGGKNAIRLWVESMVDEGKEEVVQGILERGLQKLVYDRKNPLFSTEDESAVVNPRTALKEFSGGAVVGGILGGGQMIAQGMASGAGRYAPNGTPLLTDEQGRTYEERMAAEQKNAAPRTEAAGPMRVGRATTIQNPYEGVRPEQAARTAETVSFGGDALERAKARISGAMQLQAAETKSFKGALKEFYRMAFEPAKNVPVEGASFQGQPYTVDINNNVPGKVINDKNLTAEKLALLENLPEVVRKGTYVGSGKYEQHGSRQKPTIRYDYFETPVTIHGEPYIARFDVEVLPGANNYRTHQVVEIDLTHAKARWAGTVPVPSSDTSGLAAGESANQTSLAANGDAGTQSPMPTDNSIAQGADAVKNGQAGDISMEGTAPFQTGGRESGDPGGTVPSAATVPQKGMDVKDASSAMKALGLDNITGDLGEYRNTDFLRGADAARKQTVRERRKAEARLHPTNAEKKFARGIANGDFSVEDIPASMSRAVVEEMADRYYAEASYGKRSGLQDRGAEIRRRTEEMARELFEDEESYHPISMLKMNERTPERVMRSIYGEEQGEKINEAYIYPIQRNEANKTRWMREMLDKVRTFQDSSGGQSELTRQERSLVQQLMEDRFVGEQLAAMETQGAIRNAAENIRNGADAKDAAREFSLSADELALARQLVRWTENQELLQSGQADSAKINAAVETFAKQYDLFYDAINDFLTAHGYNTIGFIKGYAPHMQGADTQNKLSNALKALGVLPEAAQLPTSISGLTADYKPGKRWNPFFQSRKGSTTDYDVSKGYESYISYLADIFYHTDDIARLRGVTRYLRKTYGSEQITDAIDHAEGLRTAPLEMQTELLRENGRINGKTVLSEEDTKAAMNEYIDKLYESVEQMTKYGELVKYLDNFANLLAGKQSMADRGMEYMAGRKSLNAANKAVSAFGRAQVAGNVSSVLNQSAQLSQILAEVPTKYVAKAAVDLGKKTGVKFWTIKDTDIFETSDLLSGKKGVDYLTAGDSRMDRFVTALFKPADIMDGAVSALAYQSKYNQLIAEGKPTAAAELGADRWATQIMASRAKGSRPLAFESKNVASQILHMFQVEALNSWEHVSQDLSAQYRKTERTKGKNAAAAQVGAVATKYLLSAFVMNRITEALYGGTPAPFDLLGYVTNAVASGLGMTANEALAQICRKVLGKMGFGDEPDEDDEERDFDWGEAMDALLYDVMNDAPFVRNAAGLLGLGDQTVPLTNIAESVGDVGEAAKNSGVLSAETGEAILGLGANLLPGGRQLQKTYQGAKTMATGGRTYGYGEKARLQYTVDQKNLSKWGQALLFGNSGLSETRDYYAEGKNGLSAKQTQTVQAMAKDGADREEVFQTIKALRDEKTAAEKMEAIDLAELSDSERLRLYREVVASKDSKRPEQFKGLMEKGLNWGQITDAYGMYAELNDDEELSASQKATQFAAWLDGEDFSAEQRAAVKECFTFWQQMRAEAKRYEALTAEGMNSGTAERLTNALAALEPEAGKEQVSARQRYAAIMDAGLSESDQLRALHSVMDEDAWKTFETANRAGVTPEAYVEFLEETADLQADRAGNGKAIAGSKKQKVLAAIDGLDITKEQKTALYYAAGYAESTLTEAPWMGLQVPRLDSGTKSSRKKSSGKSKGKSSSGSKQRSGLSKYSLDKYRLG